MRRKRLKTTVFQSSRVGQRKEIKCLLAFFSSLRKQNALLSVIHHPNAATPRHFLVFAVRLSCAIWYLFLYSSLFYTVNHLDIDIYRKVIFEIPKYHRCISLLLYDHRR